MSEVRLNAYRIMWLFVFFDLPVTTTKERKEFVEAMELKYPLDYDLRECGLSTRALCCLWRSATTKNIGEITVGEAIEAIFKYGYTIRNLGVKTAKEIEEKLGVKFPKR